MNRSARLFPFLGALLTAAALPLHAQWLGPTRTFESENGCVSGVLEYAEWPAGSAFPSGPPRVGTAFCTQAQMTIGQRATDDTWVVRVGLNTTVPDGNPTVRPYIDTPPSWLNIFLSASPNALFAPYGETRPLPIIGSVDVLLPFPGGLYAVHPTWFDLRGLWEVIGNHGHQGALPKYTHATVRLALAETTVPEPSTWVLMGTGLLAIGGVATRRRRRA
jgi:hypothetical protein